ncbi:hypothetical protein [Sulfurimonas sp.]
MNKKNDIPKGFAVGSRPRTGKISDRALSNIIGIPVQTLQDWKKRDGNWRKKLYLILKDFNKEELLEKSNIISHVESTKGE